MKNILAIFSLLLGFNVSYADSYGYGCYGKGVIAFDEANKDSSGLYIILWGKDFGISKKTRVELPRKHGSYSQGISCENDSVSILLREKVKSPKSSSRYLMHLTEISLNTENSPKITSDTSNHYQVWNNYTDKSIEPFNSTVQVVSLPEANISLGGYSNECKDRKIPLDSNDPAHKYYLVFDSKDSESTVKGGSGLIYHRCSTSITMHDASGKVIQETEVSNTEKIETIH